LTPPIDRGVLGCVVTGFVKGGTTLMKDLLVQTTDLESGFEGGILLGESPSTWLPEPHGSILLRGWRLPPEFETEYRLCRSHEEAYRLLRARSEVISAESGPLIDKLPQYMPVLPQVMRRAPGTPVVVALRNPFHVVVSWVQRGERVEWAVDWIRVATRGLLEAIGDALARKSIYLCNIAQLVQDTDAELARVQHWLGRPFREHDRKAKCGLPLETTAGRRVRLGGIELDRHDVVSRAEPELRVTIERALDVSLPEWRFLAEHPSGPLAPL
jgi:hypothetical protein